MPCHPSSSSYSRATDRHVSPLTLHSTSEMLIRLDPEWKEIETSDKLHGVLTRKACPLKHEWKVRRSFAKTIYVPSCYGVVRDASSFLSLARLSCVSLKVFNLTCRQKTVSAIRSSYFDEMNMWHRRRWWRK